jgi:hypothetical protein
MNTLVAGDQKLLDIDWKIVVITDAKQKKEANEFKIDLKLRVREASGEIKEKYLEMSPVQFFEMFKELNDIKNFLEMAS